MEAAGAGGGEGEEMTWVWAPRWVESSWRRQGQGKKKSKQGLQRGRFVRQVEYGARSAC